MKCEILSFKNTVSEDKPNEDIAFFFRETGIGMVLDGVSRDKENGQYPNPSPAKIANQLFIEAVMQQDMGSVSGIEKIQLLIQAGNKALREYNEKLKHRFPAGTVGIVFSLENNCFHYGYIGDCYAEIIRDGKRRIFTECQTMMLSRHKKEFTSDEIRYEICNHVNHPYGYGVWDGNNSAMDFVKYGSIQLLSGDVLFMYTDGLQREMDEKGLWELIDTPLEGLFEQESKTERDDRTCMRIMF